MDLSERKKKIMRAIVEEYIETAEPVSSKSIVENAGLGISSATVRNEMAELEELGYLEKPHTSAGRIPSALGYRIYVNELMRRQKLSLEETETINAGLKDKMLQLDKVVSDAGRLTSMLTNYPVYALSAAAQQVTISRFDFISVDQNSFIAVVMLSNKAVKNKLIHLTFPVEAETLAKMSAVFNGGFTGITEDKITTQLIQTAERTTGDTVGVVAVIAGFAIEALSAVKHSEAYLAGTGQLLQHPEYQDIGKAQKLLAYLSDDERLLKLPAPAGDAELQITIGPENLAEELKDSSVIVAKYDAGNGLQGILGVVGPTRMDYSRVAAKLSYITKELSHILAGGKMPPELTDGNYKKQKNNDFTEDD